MVWEGLYGGWFIGVVRNQNMEMMRLRNIRISKEYRNSKEEKLKSTLIGCEK